MRARSLLLTSLLVLSACPTPQEAIRADRPAAADAGPQALRPVRAPAPRPAARSPYLVSTAWLAEHLRDPDLVIVHVGTSRQARYDMGHVPGARFLPLSQILVQTPGAQSELPTPEAAARAFAAVGVSDDAPVVLYGDREGVDAARAFFTLDWLGQRDHAVLDGGLEAWRAESRPTRTGAPAPRAGRLTPRLRPGLVVDADWIQARIGDPSVVLLDARPRDQYAAGHIPGARSFYWKEALRPGPAPRVEPLEDLRAALRRVAPPAATVVTYCNSGMMASQLYFLARYAGYDVKLYDGSFQDWVDRGLPVAREGTARSAR